MQTTNAELEKKIAFFHVLHRILAKQSASLTQLLHELACTFSMHVPKVNKSQILLKLCLLRHNPSFSPCKAGHSSAAAQREA